MIIAVLQIKMKSAFGWNHVHQEKDIIVIAIKDDDEEKEDQESADLIEI